MSDSSYIGKTFAYSESFQGRTPTLNIVFVVEPVCGVTLDEGWAWGVCYSKDEPDGYEGPIPVERLIRQINPTAYLTDVLFQGCTAHCVSEGVPLFAMDAPGEWRRVW